MAGDQPRDVPFAPDFRVGDWTVQPSLDRLSRNGSVIHVRPQLTNLLVLLARNAGRTVSKEQIRATVWEGQFIAESGLTRCVAELRRLLNDDAREPRILLTVHKRGYRVIAPVVFLEEAGPRGSAGNREAGSSAGSVDAGGPCAVIDCACSTDGSAGDRVPRWAVGSGLAATLEAVLATFETGAARMRRWVGQRRASLDQDAPAMVRPTVP